ncbi:MAG TPA: hypothetical protein VN620_05520, partial [Candidatus Methylomirabilis sp.]|nr:hypothetical protein [Candidatus Methylomirabilis sp.]
MVDSFELSNVFRQVLTDIAASDFAKVELLIVNRQEPPVSAEPAPGRMSRYLRLLRDRDRRRLILFSLYQRLDQRWREVPDPVELVDSTDILSHFQRLD